MRLKRRMALVTAAMVVAGMGCLVLVAESYCASYSEIGARSRKRVGRMREMGGAREEMEKRMPLLVYMVSKRSLRS